MEASLDIVLTGTHAGWIRSLLDGSGAERAAYMLFGRSVVEADPWTRDRRLRLTSHRFIQIPAEDIVSRSGMHVTWSTNGFMRLLGDAARTGTVPAIIPTATPTSRNRTTGTNVNLHGQLTIGGSRASEASSSAVLARCVADYGARTKW